MAAPLNNQSSASPPPPLSAAWHAQPHILSRDAEPEGTRELWLELAAITSASPKLWMDD